MAILLALLILIASGLFALLVANYTVDFSARVLPRLDREDLTQTLAKETWNEADYAFLFRQTGLGKSALDELKSNPAQILPFQEAFFYEGKLAHDMAAVTTPHDYVQDYVFPLAPLHRGDILVSSSCHTLGWRNGHAALVVDGDTGLTLESFTLDAPSSYGDVSWFQTSSNFMLLRLKAEFAETADPAAVAEAALKHLLNVPYSVFVGFFSPKDQCKNGRKIQTTHCSHLVWQAYKNFGIDLDSNGGPLVTARDLSRSPYLEIVQINGFDAEKLW
jgi:hypothetical protein